MKKWTFLFLALITLAACGDNAGQQQTEEEKPTVEEKSKAQEIVDAVIEKHGGERYLNSRIAFDFRGRHYVATRDNGRFQYERIFEDSTGTVIRDVLTNEGFYRERAGGKVELSPKDSSAYANSVNSVIYFALLPHSLNDEAVRKEYLAQTTIEGEPYHKIKVTFRQEGGGKDYEDTYAYWIHRDSLTMDYLAYTYSTDDVGARFREAYDVRTVNGIRFADYRNYKPKEENFEVATFDSLYQHDGLEQVSLIETDNVEVEGVEE